MARESPPPWAEVQGGGLMGKCRVGATHFPPGSLGRTVGILRPSLGGRVALAMAENQIGAPQAEKPLRTTREGATACPRTISPARCPCLGSRRAKPEQPPLASLSWASWPRGCPAFRLWPWLTSVAAQIPDHLDLH